MFTKYLLWLIFKNLLKTHFYKYDVINWVVVDKNYTFSISLNFSHIVLL